MGTKLSKLSQENNKFLQELRTKVFAYSNGKTDMHYAKTVDAAMEKNETSYSDVYFIANPSTGMSEKSLTSYRCNFVDLDAGRPTDTSYFDTKTVGRFKRKVLEKIEDMSADFRPTYVVETRNGFQLYWLYTDVVITIKSRNEWIEIERYILGYFSDCGADPFVQKANQLLRIPGSLWHKRWEGYSRYKSFLTRIVKREPTDYRFQDLLSIARQSSSRGTPSRSGLIVSPATRGSRPSYERHQDVNPVVVPYDYATEETSSVSRPSNVGTPTDNDLFLADVVSYLTSNKMNYMAAKLSQIAKSIRQNV